MQKVFGSQGQLHAVEPCDAMWTFASFDNLMLYYWLKGSHPQFSSSKSSGLESDCDGTGPVLGAFAQRDPINIGRQPIAISLSLSRSLSSYPILLSVYLSMFPCASRTPCASLSDLGSFASICNSPANGASR